LPFGASSLEDPTGERRSLLRGGDRSEVDSSIGDRRARAAHTRMLGLHAWSSACRQGKGEVHSASPLPCRGHCIARTRKICARDCLCAIMIRKADDKTPKLGSDGTLLSWPQVRVVLGEPDAQLLASSPPTIATPTSALADGQAMGRRGCRSQGRSCGRSTASCTSSTAPKFRLLQSNQ
jgi:hypothetical protein